MFRSEVLPRGRRLVVGRPPGYPWTLAFATGLVSSLVAAPCWALQPPVAPESAAPPPGQAVAAPPTATFTVTPPGAVVITPLPVPERGPTYLLPQMTVNIAPPEEAPEPETPEEPPETPAERKQWFKSGLLMSSSAYLVAAIGGTTVLIANGGRSDDFRDFVGIPLFIPVAGPAFVGGYAAVRFIQSLADRSGPLLPVAMLLTPLAVTVSVVLITDGIGQAVGILRMLGLTRGRSTQPQPSTPSAPPTPSTSSGVTWHLYPLVSSQQMGAGVFGAF